MVVNTNKLLHDEDVSEWVMINVHTVKINDTNGNTRHCIYTKTKINGNVLH